MVNWVGLYRLCPQTTKELGSESNNSSVDSHRINQFLLIL